MILLRIGNHTDPEKDLFCREIADQFHISHTLLKKVVDHCPILIKKNLTWVKAVSLARNLKVHGAQLSIEMKREAPPIRLEFQNQPTPLLALESSSIRQNSPGVWRIAGRVRNLSADPLNDVWVLIQWFNDQGAFQSFEEVPLALNPLPPDEVSPFKAVLEWESDLGNLTFTFKNASGTPVTATDRRPKQEWSRVDWDAGEETGLTLSINEPGRKKPPEKTGKKIKEISDTPRISIPERMDSVDVPEPFRERLARESEDSGDVLSGDRSSDLHMTLENLRDTLRMDRSFIPGREDLPMPEAETSVKSALEPVDRQGVGTASEGPVQSVLAMTKSGQESLTSESPKGELNATGEPPHLDDSSFEEASRLLRDLSRKEEGRHEHALYPWIDLFREAVQKYYHDGPDPFSIWFRAQDKEQGFRDPYHALMTLLVHTRFEQKGDVEKALENTKRVFPLLSKTEIPNPEIPLLEGTLVFSEEQWRDLFCRAIPKLQQISLGLLEKKGWVASDLERLIQVIPHMSETMSRRALRRIRELMPESIAIDFSNHPVLVDAAIYRVAARLGVVDPHFDICRDGTSLKIQAFAKIAFPAIPSEIEWPMAWAGRNEKGSHCLPREPQCIGCLFEIFCQKLHLQIDPSDKGMGRPDSFRT